LTCTSRMPSPFSPERLFAIALTDGLSVSFDLVVALPFVGDRSRGTYGAPRTHAALREESIHIGKKRVARLIKAAGLQGVSRRKSPSTTVQGDRSPSPDPVDRDFTASRPDELWVADITYVLTNAGYLYLSVVLHAFSRRAQSWAMADHLRTELVLDALDMASEQRDLEETVHHSDQDSQYTAIAFCQRCKDAGVRPSMGSVGDYYDNAMCSGLIRFARMRTHRAGVLRDPIGGSPHRLRLRRRVV